MQHVSPLWQDVTNRWFGICKHARNPRHSACFSPYNLKHHAVSICSPLGYTASSSISALSHSLLMIQLTYEVLIMPQIS